jgi:hypothetical protein
MARRVDERDEGAERVSEDDRPLDSDGVAERTHTVGARVEAPVGRVAPVGAAVSRQVEVDDLRDLGKSREVGLEVRVVEAAGPAVEQDDGGPLAHLAAVGTSFGPSTSNQRRVPSTSTCI